MKENFIVRMKHQRNFENNVNYETFNFSAGEVHIKIVDAEQLIKKDVISITIKGRIISSNDVMELLMLNDALTRLFKVPFHLDLLYTPYSRQDRVSNKGESFTLKVFAQLINSCNFASVTMYDNHSDVSTALINNAVEVSQLDIMNKFNFFEINILKGNKYDYIISPDAGANKKSFKVAQALGIPMIQADKVRDTITGEITGTVVHASDTTLGNCRVLIVDDICDGGRTVIEITKVLYEKDTSQVDCYFTHGIFSKGIDVLLDVGIVEIYTTDSFEQTSHDNLTVVQL